MATSLEPHPPSAVAHVGELLHRVADNLKVIARNEIELAGIEAEKTAKTAAADAVVVLLGGFVGLIGLGFASVAAVDALGPVLPPLWARLLIMAVVYIGLGTLVARAFGKRLARDATPDLAAPVAEAKETAHDIERGLTH